MKLPIRDEPKLEGTGQVILYASDPAAVSFHKAANTERFVRLQYHS